MGRFLGYVRAVARRRADTAPDEPITAVPVTYTKHPVHRREPGNDDARSGP
jgi:hypothetical protein